jgi:hypothetical protein
LSSRLSRSAPPFVLFGFFAAAVGPGFGPVFSCARVESRLPQDAPPEPCPVNRLRFSHCAESCSARVSLPTPEAPPCVKDLPAAGWILCCSSVCFVLSSAPLGFQAPPSVVLFSPAGAPPRTRFRHCRPRSVFPQSSAAVVLAPPPLAVFLLRVHGFRAAGACSSVVRVIR